MLKTVNVQEAIEKEVIGFGNGSIVYTPKKWIGKKVLVILEEKSIDIKGETMKTLKPHLEGVEGVFLFGSHARNEQTSGSDIDVLVIADHEFKAEKNDKFDFVIKTKYNFIKEITSDPTLFLHLAIKEAKPIINKPLLEELRAIKVKPDFQKFLDDTLGAFKKTKEQIETNKNNEYLDTNTAIYSLILRLKGLFLIQCHKKHAQFSNNKFKELIKSHGIHEKTVNDFLEAYRAERDERKPVVKIQKADAEKLFEMAKIEFLKTEGLVDK